ncbi:MAG: cation:proton antiporter [Thermicanus sp.]|nr:cation:proton antiporter [Thermicanus sp.]
MFIAEIALILMASKLFGDVSVRLGQPAVLGKLLVGILLGPSLLGWVSDNEFLTEISEIGVLLLMFIAGLETDLALLKKTGFASVSVGTLGILLPLGLGYAVGIYLGLDPFQSLFLGLLLSATSVSISVQSLKEMNQLKTREGSVILGAAVIDDILVMITLAVMMSLTQSGVSLGRVILHQSFFFLLAILLALFFVPRMLRYFAPLRVTESVITAGLVIAFFYAAMAEFFGVSEVIGAYLAGIAVSLTDYKQEVFEKVETIGYAFFVPVFFTSIGISVNFTQVGNQIIFLLFLTLVAIATKWIGAGLGARLSGFGLKSSAGIGAGMISRGEVALILASIGLEKSLLPHSYYSVIVVMVLFTTLVTPPLMKLFFQGKEPLPQLGTDE